MTRQVLEIAVIKGDGIGADVTDAALAVVDAALAKTAGPRLRYREVLAGAGYYRETGRDIEPGGEAAAETTNIQSVGACPPDRRVCVWLVSARPLANRPARIRFLSPRAEPRPHNADIGNTAKEVLLRSNARGNGGGQP